MAFWDEISQDPMSMMLLAQAGQGLADSMSYGGTGGRGQQPNLLGSWLQMQQMKGEQDYRKAMLADREADNSFQQKKFDAEQAAKQQQLDIIRRAIPDIAMATNQPEAVVAAAIEGGIDSSNPLLKAIGEQASPYTMSGGQVRFGPGNKPVASVSEKTELGFYDPLTQQHGVDPTVFGAKKSLAVAGRPDQRVIIPPGPNAYESGRYADAAKQWTSIQNLAVDANKRLQDVRLLNSVLEGEETGRLGEDTILNLERLGKQMGFEVDAESLADRQIAKQLASKMLLNQVNSPSTEMTGVLSKSDTDLYREMQPGLDTTPEGRKLALEIEEAVAENASRLARGIRAYEREKGGLVTPAEMYDYIDSFSQHNSALANVHEKWKARRKDAAPVATGGGAGGLSLDPGVEERMRKYGVAPKAPIL